MNIYIVIAVIIALIILIAFYYVFFGTKANLTEKALALAAMGNFLDAKAIIRDQLDLSPDDPKLLFTFSKIYSMENDIASEVNYLEKVKAIGHYSKEFPAISVTNRIGNIYYQLDMSDQAFFAYLDTLQHDPNNPEALIRLAFMSVGQKDFDIADKFMRQLQDDDIKISSYFLAKGVVYAMLNRNDDFEYFEKAYDIDPKSQVVSFLYALSLAKNRKFTEAIKIASPLIDSSPEDMVKFTVNQLHMVLNSCISDYSSALGFAKKCLDLANKNEWELERAESNSYCGMFHIMLNNLEEAAPFLIEAEAARIDDYDIINLAQYRADLEEGTAKPGTVSPRGYSLKTIVKDLLEKIFPKERYFEISGLKSSEVINIRGMIDGEGRKIISKFNQLSQDKISKFNQLRGNQFKSICIKILAELGYKIKRELPSLESEGANYIGIPKDDENTKIVFRIRKWKNITISDVFLTDLLSSMGEHDAEKGFIIGDAELTPGARKVIKANDGMIRIVNGKELESILEKVMRN
jgi:tetratricopeptide (TPR) repeat protein